jgi:hypothetical protein
MAKDKPAARREPAAPASPARSFTLTTSWAAVVLALLTVLFFHEVALGGRTFVSPDASAPAGFVRIGEQMLYQQHQYPLWNPFVFLGMPSFGSGAYNPLIYPPDWPLALVAKVVPLPEMTWLLIYYFLGALFLFLLAREWGARPEGALLGAIAFMFAPNLVAVGSNGHGSQLVDSAYLPLLVWLAARWLRAGRLSDLGWLALAGGFQFLRGHVQICFYTWMAVGMYGLVELGAALRRPGELPRVAVRFAGVLAAAALAFGVAGFYNLPLQDYARWSIRGGTDGSGGVGMAYATQWSMAPYELPAIVWPNFVGFGGGTYWGGMPFTDYPNAYMGVIAMLLALVGFVRGGRTRVFALVLGAFALMVSFGSHFPLYGFLYDHLPQFKKFRVPVMVIVLFQLAVALAAAWGWSAVLDRGATRAGGKGAADGPVERLLVAGAGLLLLAGLVVVMGGSSLRSAYEAFAQSHRPQYSAELAIAAWNVFAGEVWPIALVGLLGAGVAWFAARGRLAGGLASVCMLALLLWSLLPVSRHVMTPVIGDPVPRNVDAGRDDVVQFLEKQGSWGQFRVVDSEQGNRLAGFGIGTLNGYHAAKLRLFQDLREGANPALGQLRWLSLLNVKYVIVPAQVDPAQLPPWLEPVYKGSSLVCRNLDVLPRVTVVGAYGVVPDTGLAAIDSVMTSEHDPVSTTWLTHDLGVTLGPVNGAYARVTHYGLQDVAIEVQTPGAAIVRLADQWYPDWKATVDGKPVEILRADHTLRAVVVPAGKHEIVYRYESSSVARGLALSIVSVLAAVALILAGTFLGRRRAAGAGAA